MTVFSELTDEELVKLAQEQDGGAVECLLNRYKNLVRTKAKSFFISGAESDDLIQEGMIGLYKAIRDFNAEKNVSFSAFAVICVKRQIITALKSATRLKHIPLNSYISLNSSIYDEDNDRTLLDVLEDSDTSGNPEEVFFSREARVDMQSEMDKILSKLEQEILALYLGGKTYHEIAEVMRRDVKSVDNALQRIKRKVEKNLINRVYI